MESCFTDYVGIKLCADTTDEPDSGLYINSLPGLSIEVLDNIADEDQITYQGLWSDAQDEAFVRLELDFYNELIKCFDIKKDCDLMSLMCENRRRLLTAWRYLLGSQLMIFWKLSPRLNFFTMDLSKVDEMKDFYQVEYESALSKAVSLLDVRGYLIEPGVGPINSVAWLP